MEKLKALLADPTVALNTARQELDHFRQTLFAVGSEVYNRAGGSEPGEVATRSKVPSSSLRLGQKLQPRTQSEIEPDEDQTVTADYEAIE